MNRALATLQQNQVREWSFLSDQSFDVTFTGPDGSVGLLYERGRDIVWACLTKQWLAESDL